MSDDINNYKIICESSVPLFLLLRLNEWKWVYYCLSSSSLTLQEDMHLAQELNEYTYKMIYNQLDTMRNELRKVWD